MSIPQRLVRTVFPYGSKRRVLRGPARGTRFVVEPGIGLNYALATDAAAPRFFCDKIRTGMTVYDLGANKGQMAMLFAALVGPTGRVLAFEPAPAECASLERNVSLNGLSQVRVINAAAAEKAGEMTFTYADNRPTQGKLAEVEPTYVIPGASVLRVRTVALDDLLAEEPPPDVIKIDVEGAAASVLRGAHRILDEVGPSIYLELHGPEEHAALADELLSRGYWVESLDGRTIADPAREWHSPVWCHRPPR